MFLLKLLVKLVSKLSPSSRSSTLGYYDFIYKTDCIDRLLGKGEEHLLDKEGNTIAIFIDGNMHRYCVQVMPEVPNEVTAIQELNNA